MKTVRKMHQFASSAACAKGYMNISQTAMSMTAFGFMGYALIRPHLLGVRASSQEDREAFVYLWAVIGSMLGIKDEFNMCLHPIDVVEM
jgi:ER-bound oxygenase mpaB/B'/Rubber oxygenase, catalytic domain